MPILEYLHGVFIVLYDHEAGVGIGTVETIRVVLRFLLVPGVERHGKGMFGLDLPVVEQPFDGQVQPAEGSIGVQEDDKLVVFYLVGEGAGLDPGGVAILEILCLNELVVVAVDHGISIVLKDATWDMVDRAPVKLAILIVLCRLERSCVEVQDQDLFAQRLPETGLIREPEGGLVSSSIVYGGLVDRCLELGEQV